MKVVVGMMLPDGPLTEVVGGLVGEAERLDLLDGLRRRRWLPLTPKVLAMSWIRWLPVIVSGSDQVVDVAFGVAEVGVDRVGVCPTWSGRPAR